MIKIKKVEVTPLDRNYASVVDSTSTLDDKTKNTYSMRVIDNELDGKVDGQFLVNNYYSKTDIDEITTSDTFHFSSSDGEIDVVFRRIGNIVGVYVYPTVLANKESLGISTAITLPDWAKISETSEDRIINLCDSFNCGGYGLSLNSETGTYDISLSSFFRINLRKHTTGSYWLQYNFAISTPYESDTKLRTSVANYMVY